MRRSLRQLRAIHAKLKLSRGSQRFPGGEHVTVHGGKTAANWTHHREKGISEFGLISTPADVRAKGGQLKDPAHTRAILRQFVREALSKQSRYIKVKAVNPKVDQLMRRLGAKVLRSEVGAIVGFEHLDPEQEIATYQLDVNKLKAKLQRFAGRTNTKRRK